MKWIILYDNLNLVLQSLYSKSKIQVTKDKLITATGIILQIRDDKSNEELPTSIAIQFKLVEVSVKAIKELPDGAVDDRIKNALCSAIRGIQVSVAQHILSNYLEQEIEMEMSPMHTHVLRQIVADAYLGDNSIA